MDRLLDHQTTRLEELNSKLTTQLEEANSMLTRILFSFVAQARDHGPSNHRADQLPQSHPNFETPKSQWWQEIKTAISLNESTIKVLKADRSPCSPKTPQRDVFHCLPSPETPSARGRGDHRSQNPVSTADNTSKVFAVSGTQNSTRFTGDETPKSRHTASDSAPRTPDSRGLKRKGSDLTSPSKSGVPRSGGSGAFSTELYRESLGPPPSFNLDISPETRSPSGAEARRTELHTRQTLSMNDPHVTNHDANRQHPAKDASARDSKGSPSHSNRSPIRKLAPYTKRPPGPLASEMLICEAIIKPLTEEEMGIARRRSSSGTWTQQTSHEGWIYIYQLANEVDTVKIGITQRSIEGRLDSWMEQCGHVPQIAYPTTDAEREPVPNIYRLEALVHTELAFSRLEEVGCSCRKTHIEWFDEAVAHAREVVVKWSTWMRKNPYEEVAPNSWHLSPQYIPDLVELCRPSPRMAVAEGSATKPILI